jgi:methionine synthase I (cobalamin-dependent)
MQSKKYTLLILKLELISLKPILSGTTIGMADYHLEDLVYELNFESAKIAREVADEFTAKNPEKPRFVASIVQQTERQVCHQM